MRRFISVLLSFFVLLLAAMFILPIVFKDDVVKAIKEEANKQILADLDFKDVSLSLFSSFPDFSLQVEDLAITDRESKDQHLFKAELIEFSIDLSSLIFENQIKIKKIGLDNADLFVHFAADSSFNFDIFPVESTEEAIEEELTSVNEEESALSYKIEEYSIQNSRMHYLDEPGAMEMNISDFDLEGSMTLNGEFVETVNEISIGLMNFEMEGVSYLKKVKAKSNLNMQMDMENEIYTFMENDFHLNELSLMFDGSVDMKSEDVVFDITANSTDNSFKSIISLIPAIYYQDFEDVETSGEFDLALIVKGAYNEVKETYPQFKLSSEIKNGSFKYPDLPSSLHDLNASIVIENKQDYLDAMTIDVNQLSLMLGEYPAKGRLNLTKPMSNPTVNTQFSAKLDFASLKNVIPMDGYDLKGNLDFNGAIKASMNDIDTENYSAIEASAKFVLNGFSAQGDSISYPISIKMAEINVSPRKADIKVDEMKIYSSDFSADGQLDNLLAYALNDEVLKGSLNLRSKKINADEFLADMESEVAVDDSQIVDSIFVSEFPRIPLNLEFIAKADVNSLMYDGIEIKDVQSAFELKNGIARIKNARAKMWNGTMTMSGLFNSNVDNESIEGEFNIIDFPFSESFNYFNSLEKLAPIFASTQGKYSMGMKMSSPLLQNMDLDLNKLSASGELRTTSLVIESNVMKSIADGLKAPRLSKVRLNPIKTKFKVKEGRMYLSPTNIEAEQFKGTLSGSQGIDQTIDYDLNMKIAADKLGAGDLLKWIGSNSNEIPVKIGIGGTVTKPKIKTSMGDLGEGAQDIVKEIVKQRVDEVVKDVKAEANNAIDDAIKEAEKQGDELIRLAKEQAKALEVEAQKQASNLKKEAEKQAANLYKEAGSNIFKQKAAEIAGNKLIIESDKQAGKIITEAKSQGDNLIAQAEKQKVELVNKAKESATIK